MYVFSVQRCRTLPTRKGSAEFRVLTDLPRPCDAASMRTHTQSIADHTVFVPKHVLGVLGGVLWGRCLNAFIDFAGLAHSWPTLARTAGSTSRNTQRRQYFLLGVSRLCAVAGRLCPTFDLSYCRFLAGVGVFVHAHKHLSHPYCAHSWLVLIYCRIELHCQYCVCM